MKAQELIEKLKPYADFDLQITVHIEVMEEELQKRLYKYPHDNYKAELYIDDIGHSDEVVCIGIEIVDKCGMNRKSDIPKGIEEMRMEAWDTQNQMVEKEFCRRMNEEMICPNCQKS